MLSTRGAALRSIVEPRPGPFRDFCLCGDAIKKRRSYSLGGSELLLHIPASVDADPPRRLLLILPSCF